MLFEKCCITVGWVVKRCRHSGGVAVLFLSRSRRFFVFVFFMGVCKTLGIAAWQVLLTVLLCQLPSRRKKSLTVELPDLPIVLLRLQHTYNL